jgi:hypothetical protein
MLDQARHRQRGGVTGMGIPEDIVQEQVHMPAHLRFGVQPAARIVQVDMAAPVQPGIFGRAHLVEQTGRLEFRIGFSKGGFCFRPRGPRLTQIGPRAHLRVLGGIR